MPRAGRFALVLLTALSAVGCDAKSVVLMPRDGGAGTGGVSGASGTGGGSGGSSGAGRGGASGTAAGIGGAGAGGAAASGGDAGSGGGGASGTGGGGASGTGGRGGLGGTGGSGGVGGTAGTSPLPTLDRPCDWRGAGDAIHLTFTPDGKLLLAASGNYVRAFDAATGRHVFISPWHPGSLTGVATSPDGRWFATFAPANGYSALPGGAAVWQTGDPSHGRILVSDQPADAIGFSSDSTLLAVAMWYPKTIAIFDLATLSLVASVNKTNLGSSSGLTMSSDGYRLTYQGSKTFVVASGTPWFGEPTTNGTPPRPATSFDWSPTSNIAVGLPYPGGIGSPTDPVDYTAVALSHGGFQLVAGQHDGRVSLWRLASGTLDRAAILLPAFTTQVGRITAVAFSPDDSHVASASEDGTLYVRRVSDGSPLWHAEGPSPSVWGAPILAVSPSNGQLLTFSAAYSPVYGTPLSVPARGYVVALDSDVVRGTLDPGPSLTSAIQSGSCAGSADAMAMACPDDIIRYGALDGTQLMTGTPTGGGGVMLRGGIALAPDHTRVVESIYPGGLWSWPLPAGAPGKQFAPAPFNFAVARLLFSGDGGTLASVTSYPGLASIHAWDARSGALLGQWGLTVQGASETFLDDVAISQAGDLVAAAGDVAPSIALVRPRAGTLQWLTPNAGNNLGFSAVTLSPDGTRLAVSPTYRDPLNGTTSHGLAVFGTDGRPIARPAAYRPYGYQHLIAFLDNRTLLVGENDGIISMWCLP